MLGGVEASMAKKVALIGAVIGAALAAAACSSDDDSNNAPNVGGGSAGSGGGNAGSSGSAGTGGTIADAGEGGAGGAVETPEPPLHLGVSPPPTGTFVDARDSREYRWVELDGKRWMAENLDYELSEHDVETCVTDFEGLDVIERCDEYGRFYGWSAAHGQARVTDYIDNELPEASYQGICPAGWHLPSRQEWIALFDYVNGLAGFPAPDDFFGMFDYRGIGEPFRSTMGWDEPTGTNELGFDVLPYTESFLGSSASFWASDEYNTDAGQIVNFYDDSVYLETDFKVYRHSIRCIEGEPTQVFPLVEFPPPSNTTGTLTDARDGRTYATTTIGTQHWMAENLAYVAPSGSLCYAQQEDHCRLFGQLYDFATAQTVCPTGWHLPTPAEYQTMAEYVDAQTVMKGVSDTGYLNYEIADQLNSMSLWEYPPEMDPMFGFNVLPAGWMLDSQNSGAFPTEAHFWTASTDDEVLVSMDWTWFTIMPVIEGVQSSVRCLEDAP